MAGLHTSRKPGKPGCPSGPEPAAPFRGLSAGVSRPAIHGGASQAASGTDSNPQPPDHPCERRLSFHVPPAFAVPDLAPAPADRFLRGRSGRRRSQTRRASQGRGHQVHLRPEQGLPRHEPRLLGLRAQAVRPGQAGLRPRQPGRRSVQGAGGLRRADPQEGDAGHHRRVRHARAW